MAAEEPLFDPSLKKKKKKKTVAFTEDPLGADGDPTFDEAVAAAASPPAETNGVDMGPATVHEQMVQNGVGREDAEPPKEEPKEDDLQAMFSDLKKKPKKKKEIPLDLGDDSGTSTPTAPAKKKKEIPLDLDEDSTAPAPATAAPAAGDDLDFSDLKKKKKKSTKKALDMEAFESALGESSTAPSKPKKEKAEKAAPADDEEGDEDGPDYVPGDDDADLGDDPFTHPGDVPSGIDTGSEPWLGTDRDYTYTELLSRFYAALHASNPALLTSAGKRYTIAPPSIHRDGNKKTVFANIADICKRMHRQPEHVIQYLFAEMGTTGSVDGNGRLVIKGRFLQKQVENVLRRYIVEYVTCKTCKSPDTLLTKENRIYFMSCESCGSRRSVSAIKSGFQAQVGKRSRNKTG